MSLSGLQLPYTSPVSFCSPPCNRLMGTSPSANIRCRRVCFGRAAHSPSRSNAGFSRRQSWAFGFHRKSPNPCESRPARRAQSSYPVPASEPYPSMNCSLQYRLWHIKTVQETLECLNFIPETSCGGKAIAWTSLAATTGRFQLSEPFDNRKSSRREASRIAQRNSAAADAPLGMRLKSDAPPRRACDFFELARFFNA
jgi:hypothetical protein